jgi:hypothetical protein
MHPALLRIGTNCLFIPASLTLVGGITFFAHGVLWGENGWCLDVLHIANRTLFSKKNSLDASSSEDASQSAQSLLPSQRPASGALPTIVESSASSSTALTVGASSATTAAVASAATGDVRVEMASVRSHTARSD